MGIVYEAPLHFGLDYLFHSCFSKMFFCTVKVCYVYTKSWLLTLLCLGTGDLHKPPRFIFDITAFHYLLHGQTHTKQIIPSSTFQACRLDRRKDIYLEGHQFGFFCWLSVGSPISPPVRPWSWGSALRSHF